MTSQEPITSDGLLTSLVSLAAVIWVVMAAKQTTKAKDYFSNITRLGKHLVNFGFRMWTIQFLKLDCEVYVSFLFSSRE